MCEALCSGGERQTGIARSRGGFCVCLSRSSIEGGEVLWKSKVLFDLLTMFCWVLDCLLLLFIILWLMLCIGFIGGLVFLG